MDATLVSADEALRLLGWPPKRKQTLLWHARMGRIPCVRIGNRTWFNPTRLAEFASGQ